jgi:hypothetical protein
VHDSTAQTTQDNRDRSGGTVHEAHPMTPAGRHRANAPAPQRLRRRTVAAARAVLVVTAATAVTMLGGACSPGVVPRPPLPSSTPAGAGDDTTRTAGMQTVAPQTVDTAELAALPEASTFTTLRDAPADPVPGQAPSGHVVHPIRAQPVYTAPGGKAIARLPVLQLGGDTWLPVIAEQPGWLQVLLPTRPNGATGWLYRTSALQEAHSGYQLRLHRARFELTLHEHGRVVGHWQVGIGNASAPTPAGRTFLLASILDTQVRFSDIVLPLGAHSDTHLRYGGGPGTVGIHGWPTSDVFGKASSDGCIRVPDTALDLISTRVPLGTPVLIT